MTSTGSIRRHAMQCGTGWRSVGAGSLWNAMIPARSGRRRGCCAGCARIRLRSAKVPAASRRPTSNATPPGRHNGADGKATQKQSGRTIQICRVTRSPSWSKGGCNFPNKPAASRAGSSSPGNNPNGYGWVFDSVMLPGKACPWLGLWDRGHRQARRSNREERGMNEDGLEPAISWVNCRDCDAVGIAGSHRPPCLFGDLSSPLGGYSKSDFCAVQCVEQFNVPHA